MLEERRRYINERGKKTLNEYLLENLMKHTADFKADEKYAQLIADIISAMSNYKELVSISCAEEIMHDVILLLKETIAI